MLLPTDSTLAVARPVVRQEGAPEVVGEIEDRALLKTFGQAGLGLFPGPVAIEAEIGPSSA